MKKFLFTAIVLLLVTAGFSQLNNSWIDYNKTYYKFKLAKDTLCRIPQTVLAAAGLGSTPAQNFQLWRNGKEIRLYTSVAAGPLSAGDYIEFWGEMNDGKPDKTLYRDTDFQLHDKYSLFTDTATYYLTVNTAGTNLRYIQSTNPVAGNTLPADAYFMRRVEENYKNKLNRGYYRSLGENVYSSSFDRGEGWVSNDINTCCALTKVFNNTNKYTAGPANSVTFTVSAYGNTWFTRDLGARISGISVLPTPNPMAFMDTYKKDTIRNLPLSILTSPTFIGVSVKGENSSNPGGDRIVVGAISVTYPATFNFNNEKNFYFELAASAAGNYLVINNFNNNGAEPVLYDFTSGRRYFGDLSTPGQIKFVLPPSSSPVRKFNLMSPDASNITNIPALTAKTFLNLSNTANQADYIIISNPVLYNNGSGVNYVEQYRQYRGSVAGGGYTAKVYDIDELTDQFAFGIKNHPVAVRDFIRYADQQFAVKPKFTLLLGRAVVYNDYNANQANPDVDKLALVPTFGWPASDVLLVSNPGTVVPIVPVGRIGAINGNEIGNYLEKIKQYEEAQNSANQTVADKAWMKNIIHISGGADSLESAGFVNRLNQYKSIASDTMFGAYVETFVKSGAGPVQEANSNRVEKLFNEGLSFITYFGHSSANTLAFNLSSPETYQNKGKYPFFNVSGCSAGNFFNFDPTRVAGSMSLSEKYVFAKERGSIAFFADSHFGIEPFLDVYNVNMYKEFCKNNYGGTIGEQIKKTIENVVSSNPPPLDHYIRMHLEELLLHGDPALKVNTHAKPDYIVEEQLIKVSPTIISVADNDFKVDVKILNIGKVINDSIRVTVKHKLSNDSVRVLYNALMPALKYSDSLVFTVPINPITDKGLNKIIVSLDVDNKVTELSESNNTAEKEFFIYEDEIRPVYPAAFSIVNSQNLNYIASTANPLVQQRQYTMEMDTTELFNSAYKKTYTASGNGGVIEFKPTNITFTDSTVYYWRTAIIPVGTANIIWNTSSFVYLPNSTNGWNQSHVYQHFKSAYTNILLDSASRSLKFKPRTTILVSNNGMYPTSLTEGNEFNLQINGAQYIQENCAGQSLVFTLFNPASLNPVINALPNQPGRWGSLNPCSSTTQYDFEFPYTGTANRKKIRDFMDSIPFGYYVIARITMSDPNVFPTFPWTYAQNWITQDEAAYGVGNSLTTKLKNAGFAQIDSFSRPRLWTFVYKKNDNSYTPNYSFNSGPNEKHSYEFSIFGKNAEGTITSPVFGPSKKWEFLHWRGSSLETPTADVANIGVYGINNAGTSTLLKTVVSPGDTSLNFIDAKLYPYVQLKMYNSDFSVATPYQLKYWSVNGQLVPEGTIAPNILFQMKDSVEQGEVIDFKVAFKNISPTAFDSAMKIKFVITDNNNIPNTIVLPKGKVLVAGDTLTVQYKIDTKNYPGNNTLFVDVNPNNDQPEQAHFNNILFKDFYARPDNYNPLLDVTFDGVHILNRDIVAAKPHIFIKLKDESRFLALSDTALFKVQVLYPDNTLRNYNFGDTMRFNPANLGSGENSASIDFMPYFTEDGDYELIVSGKDNAGNKAGALEYRVSFTVINKAMISNLLNYPNPFTTSTAFVFTLTGSEIPQNMRIQILTISGKVVREITKDELGPIHIGRNVTEFKWDGTDMYGQKLGNGVYLYRVLTNLNGQSLEKYKATGDKTDKYFNKGYGKMVLIR
jgi:Peptidase family C25/CARDB